MPFRRLAGPSPMWTKSGPKPWPVESPSTSRTPWSTQPLPLLPPLPISTATKSSATTRHRPSQTASYPRPGSSEPSCTPQPQPPPPYHPALVQQPASSSTATAQPKQAPVLHLHRRRDNALPVPPVRIRPSQGTAGQANDYQPDSPPSPPIPPTVRPFAFGKTASVSASAAGKGTASRTLHRRAPALAAAAEPPAPETPHRDWDEDLDEDEADDSDDEQQATIRPPKHHTRPSPAASRRILVSTATSMTPYQQPAWHNHPDFHRAPTPILDNQGDADHTNIHSNSRSDRVTRSRARQLQQESVGSAVLSRMQPMIDALNSFASVTVSGVLSLLSFFISRPIRWLSNRTNPLFTFSFLLSSSCSSSLGLSNHLRTHYLHLPHRPTNCIRN
ncbi:hypothetical protein BCR44DRAFT_1103586 [Catenaria anguillulae PL171]|uniref:Uncharacterized protein n=1 Tax=Catenaria anguillulae PL171 TaxID=765915 RepID=A0A1Y2I2L1_9FUNG|nr:hypothetical protein BCR44DRAFT_1103586 [Catenaria anguillulae PL171]